MPIPFEHSCSKKCSKHFTPIASHSTILFVFFIIFFVNIKKEKLIERKKYILKIKSIKTGEKI